MPGVVLLLNTGGGGGPSGTRPDGVAGTADGWAKCTSDAQGDCSFIVPNTQAASGGNPAGVNRDARYWVIQVERPGRLLHQPESPYRRLRRRGRLDAIPLPHGRAAPREHHLLLAGRQ